MGSGCGGLLLSSREQARARWLDRESNRSEWRRLASALPLADDFQFFAVHASDARALEFIEELLEIQARERGVHMQGFELGAQSTVSELLAVLSAAPCPCVFWLPSDAAGESLEELFLLLNQKREVISNLAQSPFVLAMHPLAWASFRRYAPDFWSVHQAVFRFAPGAEVRDLSLSPGASTTGRQARRERVIARGPAQRSWRLSADEINAQPEIFVGREAELSLLSSALQARGTKVLITGRSGQGKTHLIRAALAHVAERYPEGIWLVSALYLGGPPRERARAILDELLAQLLPGVGRPAQLPELHRMFELGTERHAELFIFEDVDASELTQWLIPGVGASVIMTSRSRVDAAPFDVVINLSGVSADALTELRERVSQQPISDSDVNARMAMRIENILPGFVLHDLGDEQRPMAPELARWLRAQQGGEGLPDDMWAALCLAFPSLIAVGDASSELMELGLRATLYRWFGQRASAADGFEDALRWHEKELEASIQAHGSVHREVVIALDHLARASLESYADGRTPATRALEISEALEDPELIVKSKLTLAAVIPYPEAKPYLSSALELAESLADRVSMRAALWGLGVGALEAGELDPARGSFHEMLRLTGAPGPNAHIHYKLGAVEEAAGDHARALHAYSRALTSFQISGDLWWQSDTYSRMGNIALDRGDLQSADAWFHAGLVIDEQLGEGMYGCATVNLARLATRRGEFESAIDWLVKAYAALRMTETTPVEEELRSCYEAAPASVRPRLREIWESAGHEWGDIFFD